MLPLQLERKLRQEYPRNSDGERGSDQHHKARACLGPRVGSYDLRTLSLAMVAAAGDYPFSTVWMLSSSLRFPAEFPTAESLLTREPRQCSTVSVGSPPMTPQLWESASRRRFVGFL
jgi:hypothetical protein